jgi:hypothetical protein
MPKGKDQICWKGQANTSMGLRGRDLPSGTITSWVAHHDYILGTYDAKGSASLAVLLEIGIYVRTISIVSADCFIIVNHTSISADGVSERSKESFKWA